jgi:starch-binding outer membrane protein, SusD/RagB family
MKKFIKQIILAAFLLLAISCSQSFLDYTPKGVLTTGQLNSADNLDKMVIAAYASLGNDDWSYAFSHMWIWGSVRSDDAYKGGGSVGDQGEIDFLEQFVTITTDGSKPNLVWIACYEGIARANDALRRIVATNTTDYPNQMAREAECRFLRGHWYFLLKELFKKPPWFDETVTKEQIKLVSNNVLTNDQLWDKIATDFQFAVDNLPATQTQVGRANKVAAQAYLAKVRLFQAYEQNDQNAVTNINPAKLQMVVDLTNAVISSGKYNLNDDFAKNFLTAYDNSIESIFATQFSYDDGTGSPGRLNKAAGLNYDMAPEFGCCDFHNPSQNMVNAFRTDANGLPLFDTFDDVVMKDSVDFRKNTVDPRLDHTIGIATHPFKYLPKWIMKPSWRRAPFVYGYYSSMKEVTQYNDPTFRKYGAFMGSAMNFSIIRYDDVLLMQAEALIELNRQLEALPLINLIRNRAKNSTGLLKYLNGTYISNYNIQPYVNGVNCNWTKDYARKALQFERRLEFAMEGPRFFDLVRWGIAAETLNKHFSIEKNRFVFLAKANFTKGRDEYLYIPQAQINLVDGLYVQNNGW